MESVAVYASTKELRRNLIVSGLFVLVGVWMISDGQVAVLGVVAVVFFGATGIVFGARLRNPKPLFELTPAGLRPYTGGLVPWRDVEDVGIGALPRAGRVVGIRLSDYTAYVRSAPTDMRKWKRADAWAATRSMPRPSEVEMIGLAESGGMGEEPFTGAQKLLVGLLRWNRKQTGGLDMCWFHRLFSDPAETVVAQILDYRGRALNA
jgi:hypothetical protein